MGWFLKLFAGDAVAYVVLGVAGVLIAGLGWDHGVTIPRLEHRIEKAEQERDAEVVGRRNDRAVANAAAASQAATFRATEQAWAARQQETERDAQTKIAAARADAATASAAAGRLRDRLAALGTAARAAAGGASAPAQCEPAFAAIDLQADVLRRMDAAGRELAAFADSASLAGDACLNAWPTTPKVTP